MVSDSVAQVLLYLLVGWFVLVFSAVEWFGWSLAVAMVGAFGVPTVVIIVFLGCRFIPRIGEADRIAYQRLVLLVGGSRARADRLLASSRRHHPFKSHRWHLEHCIRDVERDRGVY